jgi:hypothetical protein
MAMGVIVVTVVNESSTKVAIQKCRFFGGFDGNLESILFFLLS